MTRSIAISLMALAIGPGVALGQISYRGYSPSFPSPAPARGIGPNGAPGAWIGGDAGFLCPLDPLRVFCTFSDAAIGRPEVRRRDGGHGIGNTVAIATCRDGRFAVTHYFRGSPDKPIAFFPDIDNIEDVPGGTRLWVRKAFLHKERLYVFAQQQADPGKIYNTKLIRVLNPGESPERWRSEYINLGLFPFPKPGEPAKLPAAPAFFGHEAIVDEAAGFLYTYGTIVDHKSPEVYFSTFKTTALRIPLAAIDAAPKYSDLSKSAQYLTRQDGVWKDGLLDPLDVRDVGIPSVIGFSVRFNATLKLWQVVFCDDHAIMENVWKKPQPGLRRADTVYVMTGPSPFGPWSDPLAVCPFPQMDPTRANLPDRPFVADDYGYHVAEQPAFETWDGDIAFTYTAAPLSWLRGDDRRFKADPRTYDVFGWHAAHPMFGPKPDGADR